MSLLWKGRRGALWVEDGDKKAIWCEINYIFKMIWEFVDVKSSKWKRQEEEVNKLSDFWDFYLWKETWKCYDCILKNGFILN